MENKKSDIIVAVWESTGLCNLRCTHCGVEGGLKKTRELTTDEALKMMQKLADQKIPILCLSGGEFTMRKDWKTLFSKALSMFDEVRIITNARLGSSFWQEIAEITPQDCRKKVHISTSLDGNEEIHDLRRGKGNWKLVMELIESKPTDIFLSIVTTFSKTNLAVGDEIVESIKGKADLFSVQLSLPAGRMVGHEDVLQKQEVKILEQKVIDWNEKIQVVIDDCWGYDNAVREKNVWEGCYAGKRLITVLPDGTVKGCITQLEGWGNIITDEIPSMIKFGLSKGLSIPAQCTSCTSFGTICPGGCPTVERLLGQQNCNLFQSL